MNLVDRVRGYINNQEAHHKKNTFEQEYQDFMAHQFPVLGLDDEQAINGS